LLVLLDLSLALDVSQKGRNGNQSP
jgi:hypothetical protein